MIKIKLSDPTDQKNFSGLLHARDILPEYSIQLTDSNDYDYEFVSHKNYVDSSIPLEYSIEKGINALANKTGDYFLFSGADSTSLLGAYEVFSESSAKFLFKKQLLSREDYRQPAALNKWFFGNGTLLDKGYDIPNDEYNRIQLTGYNVGHNWPHLHQLQYPTNVRDIDVCAVYQTHIPRAVYDHEVRSDTLYAAHRDRAWQELSNLEKKYRIIKGQSTPQQFVEIMKRSKIGISPFGMGELCYRDLELVQWGCLLVKPDISKVKTKPDFFKPMETYVPVKPDWSNLNETVEKILGNWQDYQYIIDNARRQLSEMYSYHNVCMHWYKFFANLDNISTQEEQ